MASSDGDIGQLTESQQLALQTYTSLTDQEPSAAIPLLQRSQWNVQIAIAKFFDGEAPDPVEEARAALASSPRPQQHLRRETLLNGSPSSSRSSTSSNRDPAPRIVPQPENQTSYRPSLIFSILFAPFNILYRLLSGSFGLFGYLFPFLPRLLSNLSSQSPRASRRRNTTGRKPLSPRDNAARFVREFEEEYGSSPLQFFENGYAQAYDLAKRDLKFLLVVLISPEHDDTSIFIRGTLLSQDVVDYINNPQNNIILWAGSVQDSEAYQVSNALNCTKFPFAAIVVHTPQDSSTSMSTVARITGLLPPSAFVARLQAAITQASGPLDRVRATRAEQQATRNLREEQNSAYERSLAQDRERARQRREAEAAQSRAEQEARTKAEAEMRAARNLEQWKRWRAQSIPSEPGNDAKDVTRISIRMPSGERVVRKFAKHADIEELYAFVECYDLSEAEQSSSVTAQPRGYDHTYKFRLVAPMPRMVYDINDGGSMGERLGRSANLIVEPITEDDDEEDDR
ncbi:Ubiquitin-related domain [Lasallia pustulata]|nr:Ubiquitin-related domain [Lasallia pustulata]